jgi:hypothetical protein
LLKKYRRLVIFVIILLLFTGVGLFGLLLAANEPRVVKQTPAKTSVLPAGADDAKVSANAEVEWDYDYKMCTHHIYIHCTADKSMTGLTLTQLQASFPGVRIVSFAPDKLVLSKSFDCYCPNHYLLKRYKDELAVFITVLGTCDQEVYREIPMKFNNISEDEKTVLEIGKLFETLDDLENYLENIDVT